MYTVGQQRLPACLPLQTQLPSGTVELPEQTTEVTQVLFGKGAQP